MSERRKSPPIPLHAPAPIPLSFGKKKGNRSESMGRNRWTLAALAHLDSFLSVFTAKAGSEEEREGMERELGGLQSKGEFQEENFSSRTRRKHEGVS